MELYSYVHTVLLLGLDVKRIRLVCFDCPECGNMYAIIRVTKAVGAGCFFFLSRYIPLVDGARAFGDPLLMDEIAIRLKWGTRGEGNTCLSLKAPAPGFISIHLRWSSSYMTMKNSCLGRQSFSTRSLLSNTRERYRCYCIAESTLIFAAKGFYHYMVMRYTTCYTFHLLVQALASQTSLPICAMHTYD